MVAYLEGCRDRVEKKLYQLNFAFLPNQVTYVTGLKEMMTQLQEILQTLRKWAKE